MPTARRHHYIPQWYLAGFTGTGTTDGFITVHDLIEDKDFKTKPLGVGVHRDFNRVEVDGLEPDVLENAWSKFEGDASQAVGRIIEVGNIENKEDLSYLLNVVALLAIRNPKTRLLMNQFQDQILRLFSQNILASKSRYEDIIEQMRADGFEIPEEVTYEQVKEFDDRGEYDILIPRESNIQLELSILDDIIKQKWTPKTEHGVSVNSA